MPITKYTLAFFDGDKDVDLIPKEDVRLSSAHLFRKKPDLGATLVIRPVRMPDRFRARRRPCGAAENLMDVYCFTTLCSR
jgi:hypothetical protein